MTTIVLADLKLTRQKRWGEHVRSLANQTAFTSNTDGGERVVASDHAAREVRGAKSMDGRCSAWFQLILEND
jgi:hypothetical protein